MREIIHLFRAECGDAVALNQVVYSLLQHVNHCISQNCRKKPPLICYSINRTAILFLLRHSYFGYMGRRYWPFAIIFCPHSLESWVFASLQLDLRRALFGWMELQNFFRWSTLGYERVQCGFARTKKNLLASLFMRSVPNIACKSTMKKTMH